jgi:hypothetical protein
LMLDYWLMEDIGEQLARRDRFLRNRWKTLSPSQRLARIDALQHRAAYLLQISPDGYARFLHRNFKARASDEVRKKHDA